MIPGEFPITMLAKTAPFALLCVLLACGDSPQELPTQPGVAPAVKAQEPAAQPSPMVALQAKSHVVYAASPGDPHSLEITLADRGFARLKLASEPQVQGRRVLQHLCAGELFVTKPRASESEALAGPAGQVSRNWYDLRSAVYHWGNEKLWGIDAKDAKRFQHQGKGGPAVLAELDAETSLPTTLELVVPKGSSRQRLVDVRWSKGSGPAQVTGFQVELNGQTLWTESKVQIRRGLKMREAFFRPTDRRPDSNVPVSTHPAPE